MEAADTYLEELKKLLPDSGEYEGILKGEFPTPSEMLKKLLDSFADEADIYLELLSFFIAVILFSVLVREVNSKLSVPVSITAGTIVVLAVMNSKLLYDGLLFEGIDLISTFVKAFVPIFAAVTALSGNITLSGIYGAAALFCIEVFSYVNTGVLRPFINMLISVGVISGIGGGEKFTSVTEIIRKVIVGCQCAMSAIILGIMSLNGFAASGTDSLIFKTGKLVSGSAIPVIGSTISGSYETVAACFTAAGGIIGAAGMFILLVIASPYLIRAALFIFITFVSEFACTFFSCEGLGRVFGAFKNAGILIMSSYFFELLVLIIGIAVMMLVKG